MSTVITSDTSIFQVNRDAGSVTCLVEMMQQGNESAFEKLFHSYVDELLRFAKRKFGTTPQSSYDEEDAVMSAFHSVFLSVQKMDSDATMDREEFWKFIATITARKVYRHIAALKAKKRTPGIAKVIRLSDVKNVFDVVDSKETHPELLAEFKEQFQILLDILPREEFRTIVTMKLDRFTNQEISRHLKCGLSSVERKLSSIRKIWEHNFQAENP